MLFTQSTYIGVDPTAGERPIVYAAIDHDLQLIALGGGNIEEVLAFIAGQHQAIVAICSPSQPNQRLMENEALRQQLSPPPRPGRWINYRVAEYILRQHNIHIMPTPASEEICPRWMRTGYSIYRRLRTLGYQPYPDEETRFLYLEVYPQASYAVLLEHNPLLKHTLEGRLQRQLLLYEREVKVPDPMVFFEEITRHRLLNGILPSEILYSAAELDALVAAYSAWLAQTTPLQINLIGDPNEGQIVLPGRELKNRY
jgi:hypothetical protein